MYWAVLKIVPFLVFYNCFLVCNGITAKRIKKAVIKKNVQQQDYKSVLLTAKQMSHKMKNIHSVKHELGSHEPNKTLLSCYDDKRYLLEGGVSSLAYGNYSIYEHIKIVRIEAPLHAGPTFCSDGEIPLRTK